jgi:hypothetical protein
VSASAEQGGNELFEQLEQLDVQQLLVGTVSSLASVAFAKLGRKELTQAKVAIDAVAALVPLVEGELGRDLRSALASLQVAYADAAGSA